MNFITNHPPSIKLRVKILLIITDGLNKGIILILILLISAPAVATAFIKRYIPYHGFSKAIINNRGTQFTSTMWVILYKTLGIKRRLSLAYYCDGPWPGLYYFRPLAGIYPTYLTG